MEVKIITNDNYYHWLDLRKELWPNCSIEKHENEMNGFLNNLDLFPTFLLFENEMIIGFLEGSIREDCGYLEGIFVKSIYRSNKKGSFLLKFFEDYLVNRGLNIIKSDTNIWNEYSKKFHLSNGFGIYKIDENEYYFIKNLY
jgi:aminoglycoside 6'-N-acetyltransferase I